jgi:hypothetical protein
MSAHSPALAALSFDALRVWIRVIIMAILGACRT